MTMKSQPVFHHPNLPSPLRALAKYVLTGVLAVNPERPILAKDSPNTVTGGSRQPEALNLNTERHHLNCKIAQKNLLWNVRATLWSCTPVGPYLGALQISGS